MDKIKVFFIGIFLFLIIGLVAAYDNPYSFNLHDTVSILKCGAYNCTLDGSLNVTGNFTGNSYYGEMWNFSSSGYNFNIDTAGVYYNLTGLIAGNINGFKFQKNSSSTGGDHLITEIDGLYRVSVSMSFMSEAQGGVYGISLNHNWDPDTHRNCYTRRTAAMDIGNIALQCIMDLQSGQPIAIMVENENSNRDMTIYTVNVNAVRIGDLDY